MLGDGAVGLAGGPELHRHHALAVFGGGGQGRFIGRGGDGSRLAGGESRRAAEKELLLVKTLSLGRPVHARRTRVVIAR